MRYLSAPTPIIDYSTYKYSAILKKYKSKHVSLFYKGINDEDKSFRKLTPGGQYYKTSQFHNVHKMDR